MLTYALFTELNVWQPQIDIILHYIHILHINQRISKLTHNAINIIMLSI